MKKFINKLKEKPKLFKTLLISKKVLDILVYCFTIFIIVMLLIGANSTDNNVTSRKYKPIQNLGFISDKYPFASPLDIGCPQFLEGVMQTEESDLINITRLSQSGSKSWIKPHPICYGAPWQNFDFDHLDVRPLNFVSVYGFEYTYSYVGPAGNNYNQNIKVYNCHFYALDNQGTRLGGNYYVNFQMDIMINSSNKMAMWSIYNTQQQYGAPDLVYYFTDSTIDNTIFAQYVSGSKDKFDYAYQLGYDKAVTDVEANNNNVFGIITQGFQAVGSIFNIDLLPGFTIGTLVFIPVVVLIIIVLFHMIKG